jgi:cyclin B
MTTFRTEIGHPNACLEGRVSKMEKLSLYEESCRLKDTQYLFNRESMQPTLYKENCSYKNHRRTLIDWMTDIASDRCSIEAMHLAVHLQEKVLSNFIIHKARLQLVSTACLLIAHKTRDTDQNSELKKDLFQAFELQLSKELLKKMEIEILQFMNWNVREVTAMDILNSYESYSLCSQDDHVKGRLEEVNKHIKKYAEFFLDFFLHEYNYLKYQPSCLAAATVLCARRAIRMTPEWSNHLKHYTTYSKEELDQCVNDIWEKYEANYLASIKE